MTSGSSSRRLPPRGPGKDRRRPSASATDLVESATAERPTVACGLRRRHDDGESGPQSRGFIWTSTGWPTRRPQSRRSGRCAPSRAGVDGMPTTRADRRPASSGRLRRAAPGLRGTRGPGCPSAPGRLVPRPDPSPTNRPRQSSRSRTSPATSWSRIRRRSCGPTMSPRATRCRVPMFRPTASRWAAPRRRRHAPGRDARGPVARRGSGGLRRRLRAGDHHPRRQPLGIHARHRRAATLTAGRRRLSAFFERTRSTGGCFTRTGRSIGGPTRSTSGVCSAIATAARCRPGPRSGWSSPATARWRQATDRRRPGHPASHRGVQRVRWRSRMCPRGRIALELVGDGGVIAANDASRSVGS